MGSIDREKTLSIVERNDVASTDRDTIAALLRDFNAQHAPPANFRMLGLSLQSAEGVTVGGLWGYSAYEWLFVETLFVPEAQRGTELGRSLMERAEALARARDCTGVWLDTFAFQALGFYQRLGYRTFGELKDHPRGVSQYWLQKRL